MSEDVRRFSLVMGGPFHELLGRLKLLDTDLLPKPAAAVLLAVLAWLPSAAFALYDYLANGNADAVSYFSDYISYIRCLVAIPIVVITERAAHHRLMPVIFQFLDAKLIAPSAIPRFETALRRADDRTASAWAEGVILLAVFLTALLSARLDIELGGFDWDGQVVNGEAVYTLAGAWSHWIIKPLFQFLIFRWLWRFAVWGWLLLRISLMELRLVTFHPDQAGGLGFLSVYPMVFSGLIFALSCVLAAQMVGEIQSSGVPQSLVWSFIAAWIAFVLLVFIGPLAVFVRPLYEERERAIFLMSRLGSEHQMAFAQKWLHDQATGDDLLGSEDVSSAADIAPVVASPYTMRTMPVTLPMIIQLTLTAGSPMLAVVATQMPLSELLSLLTAIL